MLLNVGCGDHYAPGWTNIDLHDDIPHGPKPDVVCSLLSLPFPDRSAERVYCGHVLEHIATSELPAALAEIRRVIADDGLLVIVGPDINLTIVHEPALIDGVRFGSRRWPGDEHRWTATGEMTLAYVNAAGFHGRPIALDALGDEFPVVDRLAPWQFAIEAQMKPELFLNLEEKTCQKQQS